ncbi:hypothetical protein [Hydrocarboniphaga effusa]|uniref:hypothetical protein n=1 Tax=Hydrocarboniphaga effusa TaxID=243629 RepID=UPI003BAA0D07
MKTLIILACTFGVVLALGLQSLNVNGGHKLMAFCTSFVIGLCNLGLYKLVPQPTGVLDIAAYLLGGPIGILTAMRLHPVLVRLLRKREAT